MATKEDARILGSGDPDYQEEARQDAIERAGGEDEYNANPDLYWSAQQGPMPEVPGQGPQVYLPEQLPDPEVARAAGITPQFIPPTIVDESADESVQGPEPTDVANIREGKHYDWTENAKANPGVANPNVQGAPVYEENEDLDSMTKAELQEVADRRGVEIPSGATKDEMLAALR